MAHFYPSFQALALADQIMGEIGQRADGYQGRLGAAWYWRLPGGILVTFALDYCITEQRWDVIRAEAASPNVGVFNAADFPFATYGTLATSPPFIHDLEGEAEWSNRLYFQMGYLIEDASHWLEMLRAAILNPAIRPPAAFPTLTPLERELVTYAVNELGGDFKLEALLRAFPGRISRTKLTRLGQTWERVGLLTEPPRRVTVGLRTLAEMEDR